LWGVHDALLLIAHTPLVELLAENLNQETGSLEVAQNEIRNLVKDRKAVA